MKDKYDTDEDDIEGVIGGIRLTAGFWVIAFILNKKRWGRCQ
jgi:hypothetical protein